MGASNRVTRGEESADRAARREALASIGVALVLFVQHGGECFFCGDWVRSGKQHHGPICPIGDYTKHFGPLPIEPRIAMVGMGSGEEP
jgi:hypothetical protein